MDEATLTALNNKITHIKNYDIAGFEKELKEYVEDLYFYYNIFVGEGDNPSKVKYKIRDSVKPLVGEVALFKLRRGYPKELYDTHWCYVLKDTGNSFIVIPTTSVKPDSNGCDTRFEMDIQLKDFPNSCVTRMQITQIRCVDYQRYVSNHHNSYKVITEKARIIEQVKKVLFVEIEGVLS